MQFQVNVLDDFGGLLEATLVSLSLPHSCAKVKFAGSDKNSAIVDVPLNRIFIINTDTSSPVDASVFTENSLVDVYLSLDQILPSEKSHSNSHGTKVVVNNGHYLEGDATVDEEIENNNHSNVMGNKSINSNTNNLSTISVDCKTPRWFSAKISKVKQDLFVVLVRYTIPPSTTSSFSSNSATLSACPPSLIEGSGKEHIHQDIVEVQFLRAHVNRQSGFCKSEDFHVCELNFEKTGLFLSESEPILVDFLKRLQGPILLDYGELPKTGVLQGYTLNSVVQRRFELLKESLLRMLKKRLGDLSKLNGKSSDSQGNVFVELFTLSSDLIGLAMGYHHNNIIEARAITDICSIELDDISKEFRIVGKTLESIKLAREKLEFCKEYIQIPNDYVGHIIGKQGQCVHEILTKTKIARFNVPAFDDEANVFVYPNGDTIKEQEPGMSPILLVGRKSEIAEAILIIEFNLEFLKDIDAQFGSFEHDINRPRNGSNNGSVTSSINGGRASGGRRRPQNGVTSQTSKDGVRRGNGGRYKSGEQQQQNNEEPEKYNNYNNNKNMRNGGRGGLQRDNNNGNSNKSKNRNNNRPPHPAAAVTAPTPLNASVKKNNGANK